MNKTSKTLIELWEGGNEEPERPVKLDKSTKKYIHVNLKQISFSYDKDGKEKKDVKSVPVEICSKEFFQSKYDLKFWALNSENHLLCVEDESIFLQGTRDSRVE